MPLSRIGIQWSSGRRGEAPGTPFGTLRGGDRRERSGNAAARIFIVEDEVLIAMELKDRLVSLGYEVCGVASRAEVALERVVALRPDLVLMDVNLAGAVDGVEAARQLRESCETPVVFLTAYSDPALIAHAAEAGSFGYLVKPFDERDLHATIEVAIARAEGEAAINRSAQHVREVNAALEQHIAERTEELRESLAELESFSYTVAHDLRAPLRALSGYASVLMQEHRASLDERAMRLLDRIEANARRMGALVDGLLDLARLGRQPMRRELVRMRELAADALRELEATIGRRRVEARLGELPDALGDAGVLRQVWANLLSNAYKFSEPRDPAVVEIGYDAAGGAYYVRDNGVGFDMQFAGKLFKPFSRLHGSGEFDGTGIGLALVERIVRRHGGRVWADACPGEGATFYFTLGQPVGIGQQRPPSR